MHPSKVFAKSPGPKSRKPDRKNLAVHVSLSSCLHNVKELTQHKPRHTRNQSLSKKPSSQSSSPPVARQPPCPVKENANQWEPLKLASSTFSGYMKVKGDCQHPFSSFSIKTTKGQDHQTRKPPSRFFNHLSSLPHHPVPRGAALCSGEGGSKGERFGCQQPRMTKMTPLQTGRQTTKTTGIGNGPAFIQLFWPC